MTDLSQKLKSLLTDKDPAAEKELQDMFAEELAPEERGAITTALLKSYIDIANDIDDAYIKELEAALGTLKQIKQAEQKADDDLKLADTRAGLQ